MRRRMRRTRCPWHQQLIHSFQRGGAGHRRAMPFAPHSSTCCCGASLRNPHKSARAPPWAFQ
eukprot:8416041-Pyramimonas_sp.AAC.1